MKRINVKCKFCGKRNDQGNSYCDFGCRFKKYTKHPSKSGCIEWTGSKDLNGYGQFCVKANNKVKQRFVFAHRESYKFFKGEVSSSLNVCHVCDNPSCVNPLHLWVGTQEQNLRDMIKKGRNRYGMGRRFKPKKE